MTTGRPAELLDRNSELEELDRLLANVREGRSAALVLRGEAGIGKTVLLRYAAQQASGFRVVQIAGVESEMELAFAGVHQLCVPLLACLDALPAPQRDALRVALGLAPGEPPDRFLISLAVLSMLSAAAEERPLLCLVDDGQWLDGVSAHVLAFVARRLMAESVALVFAVRDPAEVTPFEGLPQLVVERLQEHDARALLSKALPGRLDARVRDRLVAETRGNPLALLDLPHGMSAAELAGGFELPVVADLPGRLEAHYQRRGAGLPEATRRLLLLAAADPTGDAALVWRAGRRLGITADALVPAQEADLLDIRAQVRFRHPLVRSAIYRSASRADRRAVHRALADAVDARVDPDARAWHRAAATAEPDEDVASELVRSADRARARGGLAAAAAFLRRAVALTGDPERGVERAFAAAEASLHAGAFQATLEMLSVAETARLDDLQRARVALLRGQTALAERLGADVPPLLLAAAKQLEPLDRGLARETYLSALGAALYGGPPSADDLVAAARAVRALPVPPGPPRVVDTLLDGLALLITEGRAAAAPALLQATRAFAGDDMPVEEGLRWAWVATAAPYPLWDDDGLRALCERQLQLARDAGALGYLPNNLGALGTIAARSGDFAKARALTAEADAIMQATGTRLAPFTELLALALEGREAEAVALIEATLGGADLGQGVAVPLARWSAAMLYNGLGRYEEAYEAAAAAISTPHDFVCSMWSLPELVEAATRMGAHDAARDAVERLIETTRPASTDSGLGVEARSRALVSEGETAEKLYREAIDRLRRTSLRADLARAHLLYGEWLRREGRRRHARAQLRGAHEMFSAMGMAAFAERARRELAATGEHVRKQGVETRDELTAQERHIAQLAREGLSNPEIGARLFLSPRTVEWHLRKVFTKLGIHSRRELANALSSSESERAPS
jgi:DNA-binding CsgD family transcriptional regulator/tetratricopeptide (TPR) repeat protein